MTWTLAFKPEKPTSPVGNLTATWNVSQPDEFVFQKSVNLDATDTLADFHAYAEKFRQSQEATKESYPQVAGLEAEMNK